MKIIITFLALLCSFAFAIPMQEMPPNFTFDDPNNSPDPFQGPQLLPYNTSDCSFPNYDSDPELRAINTCLIECAIDPSCQTLGFNRTEISCACPAIFCSDGNLYGFPGYRKSAPLTPAQIAKQPHVVAPCYGCIGAEVSPNKTQTGDCSSRCVDPTTKVYHPNQDPANTNPNLNPAISQIQQEGGGKESDPSTVTYQPGDFAGTCLNPAESKGSKSKK